MNRTLTLDDVIKTWLVGLGLFLLVMAALDRLLRKGH